jgi:UDP-N-acetylglucosamine 1-carboxyvinyltransferase
MDKFVIKGGHKLSGSVEISSSKNASLPILCATLLIPFDVKFSQLPHLNDVSTLIDLLKDLGAIAQIDGDQTIINCKNIHKQEAQYDLVRKMRASVLVLGPLLARFKQAKVSLPGGCAIGTRPVDLHLFGLEKLGAKISIEAGYISAVADKLIGCQIVLPFPSVGATENIMMAAVLAEGVTTIENAAREPEIEELGLFLNRFGAKVEGAGTATIKIHGIKSTEFKMPKDSYRVQGDRIEAATFVIAGLITRSKISVTGFKPSTLSSVFDYLRQMGAEIQELSNGVAVSASEIKGGVTIDTAPYPGFPTDVQAQMMALLCSANSDSVITENIFENRFMHVPELNRMGSDIQLKGPSAFIKGGAKFQGAPVMCTDLRASAALVLAGLIASGETEVLRVYHMDRGYDQIDVKLRSLGADIQRVKS